MSASSANTTKPPVIDSHAAAADLFDRTVDYYQDRAESRVFNYSSLIFSRRREIVHELLPVASTGARAIDFGMGPAVFAREVVNRGFEYVGIDVSQAMVDRARSMGIPCTTYLCGDLEALSEFRGQADLVMAIGLLDYLEDPYTGLTKLVDCLKPGGMLMVSFRNRRAIPTVMRNVARWVWRRAFANSRWRSDSAFSAAVLEHSFSVRTDLAPYLRQRGVGRFTVRYMDFSPFFFNFPLPKPVWKLWHGLDRPLAGSLTRWNCSTGVLLGRRE